MASRKNRQLSQFASALSRRNKKHLRVIRRLFSEPLESRLLLATVTGESPIAATHNAPVSTDISATYDEAIQVGTVTAANFVVQSEAVGPADGVFTVDGQTITFNPNDDFPAGDIINVTTTAGIQGTTAGVPRAWNFRVASTGSGIFAASGHTTGTGGTYGVAFGDVDGDGDLDALESNGLATQGGGISEAQLWLNDGNGIFTPTGQTIPVHGGENPSYRGSARFGDMDGDGDLDAVGVGTVFFNDGNGVFSAGSANFGGQEDVEIGDLDGDGDLDVMVGVPYSSNRVFLNDGSGTFTNSGQTHLGTGASRGIEFGDLDGDGDLDVFVANNGSGNTVWSNDGNGNLTQTGFNLGGFRTSVNVDLGDIDADGDLDAFVFSNRNHTWFNDGNGMFTEAGGDIGPVGLNYAGGLGDLDGDGDLDAIWMSNGASLRVFSNDGNGNFSDSGQQMDAGGVWGLDLGDLDGDGDLDVWIARNGQPSPIWLNQNLNPSVSLTVDNTSIAEAAGVATITATLSAAHTAAVTVDLGLSGDATATDDYTVSGTQIVIPIGATTGSVTITAVDDTVDEPDETVIVEMTSAANADRTGGTVTTTILDNDEPALVPDVTLSVDNAAIPEQAGVANFTATLSVVTTVAVTVDLGFSGSAASSDYTASGNQIVIAPGATTGSISVTAVQDTEDESDETVIVDITNVTGGNESGTQQQTTTITDDDEPVVPEVTLSVDNADIAEAAGVATFTATLSESTTVDVTVDLELTGTATAGDDYNASGTQITINAGATNGSVTVTAVQDELDEPDETVVADISAVTNGTESGAQQATTTITDDDEPQGFAVTQLTPTATGFQASFTNAIDDADLNLYDSQTAGLGPADVVLTGASSGPIAGSLVVSDRMVEFIRTGDPLAPDSYTVTLRSAANGFEDTGGLLLDGDGDGTPGDDYSSSFAVGEPAANQVTVGISDFVRGPGQDVNLPANVTTGIPLSLSDGTNIRAIDARITYDATRLNITAATVGADAPAGASVILNSSTPGLAILVYFSTNPLPAGEVVPINLTATVPTDNASANYGTQHVLDVHNVIISDGNDNESPVTENDALHVATFFADVTANGRINAADAAGIARVAALLDGGFANTSLSDPGLLGDISGNGRLNAADASLAAQSAALIPVDRIPPIPGGVVITGGDIDLGPGQPGVPTLLLNPSPRPAADYDSTESSGDVAPLATPTPVPHPTLDLVMARLGDRTLEDREEELLLALESAIEELLKMP